MQEALPLHLSSKGLQSDKLLKLLYIIMTGILKIDKSGLICHKTPLLHCNVGIILLPCCGRFCILNGQVRVLLEKYPSSQPGDSHELHSRSQSCS